MRSRILSSFLVASVLVPSAVRAQDQEGEDPQGSETESAEIIDSPESEQPGTVRMRPGQGGRESAPGEVHTVTQGDTLWDLSQRYLGNAWYWPKVWSYNPEIANPHWIYPGNSVRFFAGGEEAPTRVEAGVPPTEIGSEDLEAATELREDAVEVSGKISYQPKGSQTVVTHGFISAKELEEAGKIDSSFSGALMLSYPDTVYVRFKRRADAKLGDRYVVFHTTQEVSHPVSGKKVGYLTDYLGTLRVTALGDKFVTAQIMDTWAPIERGDMVGPFGERLVDQVAARRNEKQLEGHVITALVPYLTMLGEHHFVVVDKGSGAGVQVGNTFTVIRQNDLGGDLINPAGGQRKELPIEDIATCLVTEVKESTSNCVLTQSLVEVVPGDRVMMRTASAPSARR